MSEPTARWQELCNQAQEARQTFDRLCEQLLAELYAAESVRPADSKENLQEAFWQIVEMVAITDSTHGVGVGFDDLPLSYVCPFCLESLSRFAVRNGESFPHVPACIVTKARALMSEREAQPQIEVKIEKPMVCALCGKHYESADSGWCGQQSNEFCSRAHMNQWLMKERGEQHGEERSVGASGT